MINDLPFNRKPSTIIHIDLNSCFASIEQQANPLLRGKPIAVAAYTTPSGCILAPSVEAKRRGVKVGMRVKDGQLLCPNLLVLPPDPRKYRHVHLMLRKLLSFYTDKLTPRSIDEFVLDLEGYPAFQKGAREIAKEIKERIREEIGEWLTVSIGIAPNRFLAKTASALHKPDGLDEINYKNFIQVYRRLNLTDLCGIKQRNAARLYLLGIFSILDFYRAPITLLKAAFNSIAGYYWYLRLRGWEIDAVEFSRKSFGNSFALPRHLSDVKNSPLLLRKLVEKTGARLRRAGFMAKGIHVAVLFRDYSFWHHGHNLENPVFDSRDIYKEAMRIFFSCPYQKPVAQLAVSCFNLVRKETLQTDLFGELSKKESLVAAVDKINEYWGDFTITPARMLGKHQVIIDRIAFGGVKELEEEIFMG